VNPPGTLGRPRLHLRRVDSTNARARRLAGGGARHGTLVTAAEQTAGRGRQGRGWSAPEGRSLLMSLVLRDWPRLLPLAAAVAVAETVGDKAAIKWPNDVQLGGRKVAGILAEGRPRDGWMVIGIGLNVAVSPDELPDDVRDTAATMGLEPDDVEPTLARLLGALERRLAEDGPVVLAAWRARDALAGRAVAWDGGAGTAVGVDDDGRLLVDLADGGARTTLDAGEVHLEGGT
jgi:BirA family transcriptional regulator, biotin operon repressor / biotin---[acetyl-CoA-carboxylase] ligase